MRTTTNELVFKGIILLAGLIVLVPLAGATPIYLTFDCITNNNPNSSAIGESQLKVKVDEYGVGKVLFTFFNVGIAACSITDVYFDNGSPVETLSSLYGLIDRDNGVGGDNGVDFSPNASPANLPGANFATPPFVVSAGLSADSDSPVMSNGVNPGESLGVIFTLLSGKTFASVVAALASGDLRVGIHVQGFANGFSEGYINIPPPNTSLIPEPGTISLLAMGLISLASIKRRRTA